MAFILLSKNHVINLDQVVSLQWWDPDADPPRLGHRRLTITLAAVETIRNMNDDPVQSNREITLPDDEVARAVWARAMSLLPAPYY